MKVYIWTCINVSNLYIFLHTINVGIEINKELPIDSILMLLWTFSSIVLSHFSLYMLSSPLFSQLTSKVNSKVHALSWDKK